MSDPWAEDDDQVEFAPPTREDPGSPLWLLMAAAIAVLGSAATLVLGAGVAVNLFGYALASLVGFTLVAVYRRASVRRFVSAGIPSSKSADAAAIGILLVGLAIAALHAYRIARHFA